MQGEFDFIESIGVEASNLLYASIKHLPEKVQLGVLSAGIYKLLCLLLAMSKQRNGAVIIDEIENGFYYDTLPAIWRLVLQFAKENDVQVFASTHSRECLEAAADVYKNDAERVSIIRTVKINGMTEVRQFGGRSFVDAINEGIEIR